MENLYNVADRVEVVIEKTIIDPHTKQEKLWIEHYAGTVITYHNFTDKEGNSNYLYKVSVDGKGDIVICKESQLGGLTLITDPDELRSLNV